MREEQRRGIEAEINRLLGRAAETPIQSPANLVVGVPDATAAEIRQVAFNFQPEIDAARLRTQATRRGIEVARLHRRPELTLSASYFSRMTIGLPRLSWRSGKTRGGLVSR